MAVDFFEKEVSKAQDRFNETFGKLTVCDIRTRQQAILKIIKMSLIRNRIIQERVKEKIIQIYPISTHEQTADIFTKPLDDKTFLYLRKKLNSDLKEKILKNFAIWLK